MTSAAAFVRPVEAASVVERVTSEIRSSILSGRLAPGQEFSLRQIAGQLGVSFIPVREALRSLEAEGLLVTRRGRSAVVAPLDADELHSLTRLRGLIEPDLHVKSSQVIAVEELDRLEQLLQVSNTGGHDTDEAFELYHAFRVGLVAPVATAWDLRIMERVWRAMDRYYRIAMSRASEADVAEADSLRRALLAAFRERDTEAVWSATMRRVEFAASMAERSLTP